MCVVGTPRCGVDKKITGKWHGIVASVVQCPRTAREYPGGSRVRGVVERLASWQRPPETELGFDQSISYTTGELRRMQWIARTRPPKQYASKMHRLCSTRATRDARRCGVNCRNSSIHLQAPYGWWEIGGGLRQNTAAFNGRRINFSVEMRHITAFWVATNSGGYTDFGPRNCTEARPGC